MTGHTGAHHLKTTAENMGIKLTGKLGPCEVCAEVKIRQANIYQRKSRNKFQVDLDTEYSLTQAHSNMKVWVGKDIG